MVYYYDYLTEIGKIRIIEEEHYIIGIRICDYELEGSVEKETDLIRQTYQEIREYFDGKRREFTIPLKLIGTEFQKRVWEELRKIPYGETISYKELACRIGNPKAVRAVGRANGKNSIIIVVPCHRVINHNGKLGGYTGGLDVKRKLLKIEEQVKLVSVHTI